MEKKIIIWFFATTFVPVLFVVIAYLFAVSWLGENEIEALASAFKFILGVSIFIIFAQLLSDEIKIEASGYSITLSTLSAANLVFGFGNWIIMIFFLMLGLTLTFLLIHYEKKDSGDYKLNVYNPAIAAIVGGFVANLAIGAVLGGMVKI